MIRSASITVMPLLAVAVCGALLLWFSPAQAQVEAHRLPAEDAPGVLWIYEPDQDVSDVVLVMPGAQIAADRYMWLERGLSRPSRAVVLVEADRTWRPVPGRETLQPARLATIRHLIAAMDAIEKKWPEVPGSNITLIGHSLGGSVILEALDGESARRNPWAPPPADFDRLLDVGRVVILGASLQSTVGDISISYRTDTGALSAPATTQLLFIAAEHDLIGTPEAMRLTAKRYAADIMFEVIEGGNHLAWGSGTGILDRPDMDGIATISEDRQLQETVQLISSFLAGP